MRASVRGRRLAIIGAGHAHVELIRRLRRLTGAGAEVTVVDPEDFWYSGLATGMLGGRFDVELDRVDAAILAERVGARFVRDRVEAIDPGARVALLAGGEALPYDLASLDVGSRVPVDRVEGLAEHAFAVKPIRRLAELRADLSRRFRARGDGPDGPTRVLVLGGGAAGCEVAANVAALAGRLGARVAVTIASAGDRLLGEFPGPSGRHLAAFFDRRGDVSIRLGVAVERLDPGEAVLASGDRLGFDVAIAAIGLVPPPLIGRLGLPTADDGRLLVDPYLRSVAMPTLFAAGDCATLVGSDLPRIGAVAVRQAPVLARNLRASLLGRRLRRFRPRRRYLQILNLGDGTGLARFGPLWHRGRSMLCWKDALDLGFLRRFG